MELVGSSSRGRTFHFLKFAGACVHVKNYRALVSFD
ncbi:hypothetical protein LINPERPRIM_LOCUS38521 [Linum perenne]